MKQDASNHRADLSELPASTRGGVPNAAHRAITGRLVIATHNPGKLRGDAGASGRPTASTPCPPATSGSKSRTRPAPRFATMRASRRPLPQRRRGYRRSRTIRASRSMRSAGRPAFSLRAGPGRDKDFQRAMQRVEDELNARGAATPSQRKAHFVSALCVAWPDGHTEDFEATVDGTLVWPGRGDAGVRLRSDVPARRS